MPWAVAPDRAAVVFVRALRDAGLDVPVGATVTFAEALSEIGMAREASVYWAGRATLVTRVEKIPVYDRVFSAFWRGRAAADDVPVITDDIALAVEDDSGEEP